MNNHIEREKIPFKKIISNNLFVFRYALSMNPKVIIFSFFTNIITTVGFSLFSTLMLKMVIDAVMAKKTFREILTIILIGMTAIIILEVFNICTNQYFEAKITNISGKIQRVFIKKAARIDLMCYDNPKYFDDYVIAAAQAEEMLGLCVTSLSSLISSSIAVLTISGIIFTINPIITVFPVTGFFVNLFTRYQIIKTEYEMNMAKKIVARKSDYSKRVFYQPEYAKEIKLSGIATPLRNQFDESIEEQRTVAKKYGIKIAVYSLINWITVFTFLSFFCLPAYLGYLALVRKEIALGDVASMNTAANSVRGRLDQLNYVFADIQKVGLYAERFRKFVEYEVNIEESKGTKELPSELSIIEIKNMSFKYDGSENYALKNINITINPKEKIALVGHNGAGKTTFVKLLMRLYDVTEGEITYGDSNIKDFSIKDYRDNIGVVFQDYQVYAATLSENVIMDNLNENSEEVALTSLQKADFSKKLQSLSMGIDTELTREFSDDGTAFSGGEAQKLAIARMFAKPFKVAILDEPSSALDPIAEYKLNKSMMENAEDASIIFISHRLSTTKIADKIYMFENGEIIEEGTHAQLMEKQGKYATMFEKQAHYYVEE
ncbi:ABC transporter ATP-binding protein [Clostridium cellulovorans]|uniref:ABC transporter related n=1 Tax=Clostridium cellulovorans (strain ATCC 35296 / DSM 3052 / OCM 3 / 743B) TaxID=573061 RepID=D9SUP4_CLOC7|nr:ABC transporter ATP-binding protein [Clostridium cellulovorans]ADL50949.1 ABC transporter related [Clostridium cellulovorans 743B]